MMICKPFDVVVVPFPFSDTLKSKRRKALVVSSEVFNRANGGAILMMITSAHHGDRIGDVPIRQLRQAGPNKPCIARKKLFTLDNALIIEKCGNTCA